MTDAKQVAYDEIQELLNNAADLALKTYYNDTTNEDKYTALGVAVGQFCKWTSGSLKAVIYNMLEESNFHELNSAIDSLWENPANIELLKAKPETSVSSEKVGGSGEQLLAFYDLQKQAWNDLNRIQSKLEALNVWVKAQMQNFKEGD